ncbi:MAG: glycoside hydrolase family 2 protein [Candidatus Dormibacteraeota bacterium]|nr:glycoside hydrolase family 2 protein [Candidatus Dormibacteraeota bacterium]
MQLNLGDGWTVRAVGGDIPAHIVGVRIPAAVPGCVHLDLLAAGLIPDPYLDDNELQVAWVGRADWRYETVFHWDGWASGGQVDLVALGLDTVATVELNGNLLARTRNMHRSYRFPVAGRLRSGANDLAVTFASALNAAERASEELGPRPHANAHPYNAIRKMACNFGWDWGPDLVTAGIWRPLRLETWHRARIAAVRPLARVDGKTGRLSVHVDAQRAPGHDAELRVAVDVTGTLAGATLGAGQTSTMIEVAVPDVQVWWPHGYGAQPLYTVEVALSDADGHLDDRQARIGFRNVSLDTTPDEHGTRFALMVNGGPVFARGANWIPDDCFPSRIGRGRYRERLSQAREANVNLVRVWGGGIYESEDFYDICDELGLLVWQDFPFACAAYAEEEPLRSEVIAEAREAVTRLSAHASLALWNGGNENIWGYEDGGWKGPLEGRTWGWGYYTDILPAIVGALDPGRPYSPGSPYSFSAGRHPNDAAHGTVHIWDVWNQVDYSAYRDYRPRFVTEFGFQGPPAWATLTRAIHDQPLGPDSPGMRVHQKAADGDAKLARGLRAHLPATRSFADWHWATSLNQARAVALGVEHFRSLAPDCTGAVLWQLNDCWPVTSWAAIDGDGRRKPLWYALRRAFRDRLLTLQPRPGGLALIAVNDDSVPWRDVAVVTRRSFDGSVLASVTVPLDLRPRRAATAVVPRDVATAEDPASELLLAESGANRAWWYFVEDIEAALPGPDLDTRVERLEFGYGLTVTAQCLVRDLALLPDRVAPDAIVDEMLVTLLPGESAAFEVCTTALVAPAELTQPLVLRSANQLVIDAIQLIPGSRRVDPAP